jgi:7,8-dihydropterin-6-yl-methyl-4-(beta-D-ribofuranosyl)aminobenzene 5'-phosphate synthase
MDAKIVNVYNNEALPANDLKSGHGESFHITIGDQEILFDLGWKGNRLMHNMNKLGINPDEIDKLVFSHGHTDHTGGLPAFLKARTVSTPIPITAHPAVLEPKSAKILIFHMYMGFPKLSKELKEKVEFQFTKSPVEILPKLSTTGEITIEERQEKPGIENNVFHKVDGQRKWDPVIDDLCLILQTKDGLVIITGCCHAGILNACAKATKLFNNKIKALLGGTHMLRYSREDVKRVGDVLENLYGTPELYLNHCTGKKAIEQLENRFGLEVVHECHVGTELVYQV